jgi:endonuclease/exonuclease/phosphatase family metal-dependent hydrolase
MTPLRVVTLNIAFGEGRGGLDGVVRHLRDEVPRADFVCLQECDRDAGRTDHVDQAQKVAADAGYPYHLAGGYVQLRGPTFLGGGIFHRGWGGGKAVLSPHQLSGFDEIGIYSGNKLVSCAISVRSLIDRLEHVIYVLHWPRDSEGWEATRDFSIYLVNRDPPDVFVLIVGDFNSTPDDPDFRRFGDLMGNPAIELSGGPYPPVAAYCDTHLPEGDRLLDYVLYRRGGLYTPRTYTEHCGPSHPSDHRTVEVTFDAVSEPLECASIRMALRSLRISYATELNKEYEAPPGPVPVHNIDPARDKFNADKKKSLEAIQAKIDREEAELRQHGCRLGDL